MLHFQDENTWKLIKNQEWEGWDENLTEKKNCEELISKFWDKFTNLIG